MPSALFIKLPAYLQFLHDSLIVYHSVGARVHQVPIRLCRWAVGYINLELRNNDILVYSLYFLKIVWYLAFVLVFYQ